MLFAAFSNNSIHGARRPKFLIRLKPPKQSVEAFMAVTANQLSPQVTAAIRALEKLPAKEREVKPSKAFVDNYNNLLGLAKEAMQDADIDDRRWPPAAGLYQPAMGQPSSEVRFTEIHSFLEQMNAILNEGIEY